MTVTNRHSVQANGWLAHLLVAAGLLLVVPAHAACPAGQAELLPNVRAVPPRDIAMLDADNMKFSATSWNSGDGKLELVARTPTTDQATGQLKQPIDQRIYCSGGGYYDRSAGSAEYHPTHNHVHFNDYANYILEQDTASPQNPRKGTKTSFCIMDTTSVNTQLNLASASAVFSWCPTQDPNFNTQGMSVGWGDTYGSSLAGQSLYIGDLAPGDYRLRHVFDPKTLITETVESDNESCRRIQIGDGINGRFVTDRGPCVTPPTPRIDSLSPVSASQNTCVPITVYGANLAPELRMSFRNGSGPVPTARNSKFDPDGNYVTATVCVPQAKGGKKPQLGSDPVWDVVLSAAYGDYASASRTNAFRVNP